MPSAPNTSSDAPESGAAAAADSALEADFQSRVHLAHTALVDARRRRNPLAWLVVSYGTMGAVFALFVIPRLIIRALGLPTVTIGIIWAALGLCGLALLARFAVTWFRHNRTMPANWIKGDPRYRVQAVALEPRQAELRRLGPFEDTPFEPQEFTGLLVLPPTGPMIMVWVMVSLVVAVAVLLLAPVPGGLIVFALFGAFAAGGLTVELLWPTTIRVVPGRLDLVRRFALQPDRGRRRSFALRTARVMVDLRNWSIIIEGPTHATSVDLWIWPIRGRLELAHAVLLGAISSSRPGPISLEGQPAIVEPAPSHAR